MPDTGNLNMDTIFSKGLNINSGLHAAKTWDKGTGDQFEKLKDTYVNRWWRLQNLYKIRDKNKNLVNLKFNSIQLNIIKDIVPDLMAKRPLRQFDLKYRQGGVSTFWLLFWLDETIFNSNVITGILADKHDNLKKLMLIIRNGWESMPLGIRPPLIDDSKERLSFKHNNSEIFAALSIRSTVIHNLHISEWCFCEDDEIRATLGAISPATNVSGESTGNGLGNDGYEVYQDAKLGLNGYKARFSPWFIQKEYKLDLNGIEPSNLMNSLSSDEKKLQNIMINQYKMTLSPEQVLWRRQMKRSLRDLFPQEFPETDRDAFISSGVTFFDSKKMEVLYHEARDWHLNDKPYAQDDVNNMWIQFKPPVKTHQYAAGADTSEGSIDYSVLKIIDVTDQEEVFVYRAKVNIQKFYEVCNEWCRLYNNALLGVERNNHGHAVLLGLEQDCRYPNLYDEGRMSGNTRLSISEFSKMKLGWNTTSQSRNILLDHLKFALEGDPDDDEKDFQPVFTVYDKELISEVLTFRQEVSKLQAVAGKHDDDIFATAIAYQMFQIVLRHRNVRNENQYFISGKREIT